VFEIWLGYNNWIVKWIDIIKSFVFLDDNKSEDEEDKEEVTANEAVVGSGGGGWPFCAEFEVCNCVCVCAVSDDWSNIRGKVTSDMNQKKSHNILKIFNSFNHILLDNYCQFFDKYIN